MNKIDRMRCNDYYHYINLNPKDKYVGDCVIRAVALMTNSDWKDTVREMTEFGIDKGLVLNDNKLYPEYLKSKGFVEHGEPRDSFNRKITVREFVKLHPEIKNFVAKVGSHHVTAVRDGMVQDIWDCSRETLHRYWVRPSSM